MSILPKHRFSGWMDAPFTRFTRNNTVHGIAGLALQAAMFLEGLASCLDPKTILLIGNAFGARRPCPDPHAIRHGRRLEGSRAGMLRQFVDKISPTLAKL